MTNILLDAKWTEDIPSCRILGPNALEFTMLPGDTGSVVGGGMVYLQACGELRIEGKQSSVGIAALRVVPATQT